MERRTRPALALGGLAAVARISEMHERSRSMTTHEQAPGASAEIRAMWALGDYDRFARATVWEVGERLVRAAGVEAGRRVLDVAAGSGNVALRAAERGAEVTACDLTPENFEAGRRAASERGLAVEWVEANAEALPFEDGEFDVVASCFGVMFAADQGAAARELVRVCRPGGTIALASFTPDGLAAEFFALFGAYAPEPPPGAVPPVMWGDEAHVRSLLGDGVVVESAERRVSTERLDAPPAGYVALYKDTFGPAIAIYAGLADAPERRAALDRDFLAFVERASRNGAAAPVECDYPYLELVARRI